MEDYRVVHDVKLLSKHDAVVMKFDRTGEFENESIAAWRASLQSGCIALDIGMYTGIYTILAAFYSGVIPVGWEPNPNAVERAKKNFSLNQCPALIEVINAAASDREEDLSLYLRGGRPLTSAATIERKDGEAILVKARTIDEWWRLRGEVPVSVMKIDAERSEPSVIKGAVNLIEANRPAILVEALETSLLKQLINRLYVFGYDHRILGDNMVLFDGA